MQYDLIILLSHYNFIHNVKANGQKNVCFQGKIVIYNRKANYNSILSELRECNVNTIKKVVTQNRDKRKKSIADFYISFT